MKKIFLTLAGFMIALLSIAQSPNLMNYQGVARNAAGNVIPNQPIGLRLSILNGGPTGPAVYSETRNVTTNGFGLFNVVVGSPGAINSTGTIAGINWTAFGTGSGTKFLQVEIDALGGTNYFNVGSTQLVSTPYALNAAAAAPVGPAGGDLTGTYPNPVIAPLAVTTPKIADGAVTSAKVTVPLIKVQADAGALIDMTNSGAGAGVSGINTGTGFGGLFSVNNPASVADGIRATTNGTGASWAIRGISSGTNGAGLFQQTNATNTSNNLQSNQAGLGRAGLFNSTNAAATANAVEINMAGTGYALRAASTNAVPLALQTAGAVQHTGIGEALNFVLRSDAAGNATWVDPAVLLPGANFWSRVGTNLFNTNLGDNVGVGTNAPTHKFTVSHTGSTGISVSSTAGFSVVDIDAASGDAALRFGNAGVNQWNMRNRPGDNYLEWFELGGGGSRMVIQDATGNVGIGETANPTYKLDVLHGGSTGIRSRSSASFSVVDIDANSGDAALRFQKAGAGQWNTRNRPADDYYEIFELGGGGSRFVIQDGTGNVGIAEQAPSYKLDVLHGGSTGIRSRSSASFSVVDIDANSGDAALRFQKAGVNQWNTRNNPGTDDYQIFELGGGGERLRIENTTGRVVISGDLDVAGTLTKGAGAFKIDHPLDPANKYLVHSFVESPDMMNIYNGNIVTDASGKATVQLPDYFEALNMEFRYQLTVMGISFAQAIVSKEVAGNKFEITTNMPNTKVSWQVTGVRHDAYAEKNRIPNTIEKEAKNKGKYLSPESFNMPKTSKIGYSPEPEESSLKEMKVSAAKVANPLNTNGGSLTQGPIVAPEKKAVDNSGSVAPQVKKEEAKPIVKQTEKGSTEQ